MVRRQRIWMSLFSGRGLFVSGIAMAILDASWLVAKK